MKKHNEPIMQSANRKISPDNWTHTQYALDNLRALISFGADYKRPDELIYFATLLDQDDQEVFQADFTSLQAACDYINLRYENEWPIVDLLAPPKGKEGGCASCVAH